MRAARLAAWAVLLVLGCEDPDFTRPDAGGGSEDVSGPAAPFDAAAPDRDADRRPRPPRTDAAEPGPGQADADAAPDDPTDAGPPPDGPPEPPPPPPDAARPGPPPPALIGRWVSRGADVAPLLAGPPVRFVRIDAEFTAGGTFAVTAEDADNRRFEFTGRYTVDTRTQPAGVALDQQRPEVVRSEGIWAVEGDRLTYEVAQVRPPLNGVTAPTARNGFGSTSNGAFGRDNVQIYRRAP